MAERWNRGAETNAEGVRIEGPRESGMWRGCPPPQPTRGVGVAAGSGAEPRPKTNLVHCVAARRTLIATICLISLSLNTAELFTLTIVLNVAKVQ